jgi:hypothetical protein
MPEHEIWRAAMATVKRYTADAMLEAAARADQRTTGPCRDLASHSGCDRAAAGQDTGDRREGEKVH